MVVGGGLLRVDTGAVRVGSVYDGVWVSGTTPSEEKSWNAIAYGNGAFVAVGTGGVGNRAMSSPDGILWTIRPSSADNTWNSLVFGDEVFVAVASGGTNRCMTSADAGTWTGRACPSIGWTSVAYGNGAFIAVANSGTGTRAMRSTNAGSTWTLITTPADNAWQRGVEPLTMMFFLTGRFLRSSGWTSTWSKSIPKSSTLRCFSVFCRLPRATMRRKL